MTAPLHIFSAEPLGADIVASLGRLRAAGDVAHVAVMPDAHLAHDVCIGTVLATRGRIYPAAVGGDIGCGMAALSFDAEAPHRGDEVTGARLLSALYATVPSLKHRRAPDLPEALAAAPLSHPSIEKRKAREGRWQLGTLGRGNHFVELQRDDEGRLWLMVHTGSRAMGVAIRDHHLRSAPRDDASGLRYLDAESAAGRAYLEDHDWALRYADVNRRRIATAVSEALADVLGAMPRHDTLLTCHHNHVRREEHGGESLHVHRKGAISALEGEAGIIPGSMGTPSYHTVGRGAVASLCSSSHGAGRQLSRAEARRRIPLRTLRRQLRHVFYDQRTERALLDEAPDAYRDIHAVMRAQRDLTRILRRLHPVLSFKGG